MMLRAAWPQAIQGNLKAVMVVVRVLKQEAKFYGLDDGEPDGLTPEDGRDGVCLPCRSPGMSPLSDMRPR